MCGIAGIVSASQDIPLGPIASMVAALAHRGPDAQRTATLPHCHLGHTRLSIIDLAGGQQPMTEERKRYWIVFNGEIFNYRELRQDLVKQGWNFRSQSDTEVLLCAYQHYGDAVLSRLNGQFAFAIWDQQERVLFAGRDRIGEKPFYYAHTADGTLILASELKAIVASQLIQPQLDPIAVEIYLSLLYVPPHRTIYQNVHVLPPAHALCWHNGRLRQWSYWHPRYSHQTLDLPDVTAQLQHYLAQAVTRQMVADVPVGAFLSGGLDSSTIVALMSQQTSQPIQTFAVGFGDLINELPYAAAVAQRYQTQHRELQMDIPVGDVLQELASVYDEPFADSSNIPTYLMAKFARQYVKVVLAGDGGDELFGGYEWYAWLLAPQLAPISVLWLTMKLWGAFAKLGLPVRTQRQGAIARYQSARLRGQSPDRWAQHLAAATELSGDRYLWWQTRDYNELAMRDIRSYYQPAPTVQEMDRVTDFDLRCYLPGDMLVKVDRAAMAHGLEARSPFLDVDLVEFVLSLPWQLRFQDGHRKFLLRQACADLWPEAIQQRSKQGFGAPIASWLQRSDIQALLHRVRQPDSPLTALLPGVPALIHSLAPQQQWTVLCLGLWLEPRSHCLNGHV